MASSRKVADEKAVLLAKANLWQLRPIKDKHNHNMKTYEFKPKRFLKWFNLIATCLQIPSFGV